MKKALHKLRAKLVNKFKYCLNILFRLLKVICQVGLVCFPMSLALIVVNSILGVHIRLSYYVMMATWATIGISLLLILFNWRNITNVKFVKTSKEAKSENDKDKSQKIQRRKRRIS